jgi:hypothetical protein
VKVWVVEQRLGPGVQDGEKADLSAEMTRVAGDLEQCLRCGAKEDLVDRLLVVPRQGGNFCGHGEHDVEVGNRQKILGTRREPLGTLVPEARGAVAAAAAVVGRVLGPAVLAPVEMPPERGGAAAPEQREHCLLGGRHRLAIRRNERSAETADDVAQCGRRRIVYARRRALRPNTRQERWKLSDQVQRAARRRDQAALDVGVERRGRQRRVTEQRLHGADVGARLEQMSCEAVTPGITVLPMNRRSRQFTTDIIRSTARK